MLLFFGKLSIFLFCEKGDDVLWWDILLGYLRIFPCLCTWRLASLRAKKLNLESGEMLHYIYIYMLRIRAVYGGENKPRG